MVVRHEDTKQKQQGAPNLCTCHILLHLRLLLQELGPSPRPPVEDDHVLVHHVLVGFIVVRPLKAVGVNPTRIKCTGGGDVSRDTKQVQQKQRGRLTATLVSVSPPFLFPLIP